MTKNSVINYKNHKLKSDIKYGKQKFAKRFTFDLQKPCSFGYSHAFSQTLV